MMKKYLLMAVAVMVSLTAMAKGKVEIKGDAELTTVCNQLVSYLEKKPFNKYKYADLIKWNDQMKPALLQAYDSHCGIVEMSEVLKVDFIVTYMIGKLDGDGQSTQAKAEVEDAKNHLLFYRTVNLMAQAHKKHDGFKDEFEAWGNLMNLLHQYYSRQIALREYNAMGSIVTKYDIALAEILKARVADLLEIVNGITSSTTMPLSKVRVDFINTINNGWSGDIRGLDPLARNEYSKIQKEMKELKGKIEPAFEKWLGVRKLMSLNGKNTVALIEKLIGLEGGQLHKQAK